MSKSEYRERILERIDESYGELLTEGADIDATMTSIKNDIEDIINEIEIEAGSVLDLIDSLKYKLY